LISINVPSRMQTGAPGTISLSFDVGSPTDTTVTLSSSNPSVLTVPPAVVVSAGNTFFRFPITAGVTGSAVITAQAGSRIVNGNISVVTTARISSVFASTRLEPGATVDFGVSLDAGPRDDTTVTITNSNPGVVSAPASVLIPAGGTF